MVVVGGGLSGLAAAHRIHERSLFLRRPIELVVLEAKDRVGGVIGTTRFDGFTVEEGPDSFITNKPWGLELCRRLGLGDQVIETDPSHRRSFVVRNGRLAAGPGRLRVDGPVEAVAGLDLANLVVAGQAATIDGPGHPPPR